MSLEERIKIEEQYEKCRALISVLAYDFDDADRDAIISILSDCFKSLGDSIGVTPKK